MKTKSWVVGRYPNGDFDAGGKASEYLGGWTCVVDAATREEALKKGKSKYRTQQKKAKGMLNDLAHRSTTVCIVSSTCPSDDRGAPRGALIKMHEMFCAVYLPLRSKKQHICWHDAKKSN